MKLCLIGHAKHGKDTTANFLRDIYNLQFVSSSYFVAEKAVRPYLAAKGIEYPNLDVCYADRVNHRADWFDAIATYNKNDPARLGKELLAKYDVYCGLRRKEEFDALRACGAFHIVFWVDRSLHQVAEPRTSNEMTQEDADFTIDNNGSLDYLRGNVIGAYSLAERWLKLKALGKVSHRK